MDNIGISLLSTLSAVLADSISCKLPVSTEFYAALVRQTFKLRHLVGQPILAAAAFPGGSCFEKFSAVDAPEGVMQHYERRLPHWDVVGQPLFVTFVCTAAYQPAAFSRQND